MHAGHSLSHCTSLTVVRDAFNIGMTTLYLATPKIW